MLLAMRVVRMEWRKSAEAIVAVAPDDEGLNIRVLICPESLDET